MAKFQYYNPNPQNNRSGDCVVRAISKLLDQDWERTYIELCLQGFMQSDMPSSNAVWGQYLRTKGYKRNIVPTECTDCYTVKRFCDEHEGTYLLAISGHVVCTKNDTYFDTWDSGDEIPVYYWHKKEE